MIFLSYYPCLELCARVTTRICHVRFLFSKSCEPTSISVQKSQSPGTWQRPELHCQDESPAAATLIKVCHTSHQFPRGNMKESQWACPWHLLVDTGSDVKFGIHYIKCNLCVIQPVSSYVKVKLNWTWHDGSHMIFPLVSTGLGGLILIHKNQDAKAKKVRVISVRPAAQWIHLSNPLKVRLHSLSPREMHCQKALWPQPSNVVYS